MGTRSTTKFVTNDECILKTYKQFDGYPDGWGQELKNFIKSGKFVNGFRPDTKERLFNGFGDFVLQVITHFKTGTGGIYATSKDDFQLYNYTIDFKGKHIEISCLEDESFYEKIEI